MAKKYWPGSSVRDPFGCFVRDLFRGENVTSIWVIKFGHEWKKLVPPSSSPNFGDESLRVSVRLSEGWWNFCWKLELLGCPADGT